MTMDKKLISSFEEYEMMISRCQQKIYSNNYLQADEINNLILQNKILAIVGKENIYIFVKKEECQRLYYMIGNVSETVLLDDHDNYVTEILFRDIKGYPSAEVDYLKNCGMEEHLVRDLYEATYGDLKPAMDVPKSADITVEHARSEDEAKYAIKLFNGLFDHYSGDYIPENYSRQLFEERKLLIARYNDDFCGALQMEKNRACWIAHLAVEEKARGRHIASALISKYVEMNYVDSKTRYAVWVQRQNEPAVNLYKKSGFKYTGKSTLSMLKLRQEIK